MIARLAGHLGFLALFAGAFGILYLIVSSLISEWKMIIPAFVVTVLGIGLLICGVNAAHIYLVTGEIRAW